MKYNDGYNGKERRNVINKQGKTVVDSHLILQEDKDGTNIHDAFLVIKQFAFLLRQEVESKQYLNQGSFYCSGNVNNFLQQIFDTSETLPTNNRRFEF